MAVGKVVGVRFGEHATRDGHAGNALKSTEGNICGLSNGFEWYGLIEWNLVEDIEMQKPFETGELLILDVV
jgi:hypothetical protein